ncbi:MAG: RagB/SusD family nutrient uptake outer membrane protein [Chryseobacterium sp.]|nr:MAG: RagB/SusD family nutrient uptake outer membrane protein [Chryseobacterium sp.]
MASKRACPVSVPGVNTVYLSALNLFKRTKACAPLPVLHVAEAYYRTGNGAQALVLLNKLRAERYTVFTPGTETGQALLDAILKERRLELAFENDRWYTLKRLNLPVQRSGKGDLFDGTGTPAVAQTLAAGSFKWQWPIPISAIQANPNIKQNDQY